MSYEQKVVQYLEEAHATEVALIRVLQSQIAMTPQGSLRAGLERHLDETRDHAERVRDRARALQSRTRGNPLQAWLGLTEAVVGQALALGKAPLDMVRGTGGEEKVLKNAKDDCATEALEIATYTAIERLARDAGDEETAELAASILADERRMLDLLLDEEIPKLTAAVARAELQGRPSFAATTTGAADAVAAVADQAAAPAPARAASRATRRTAKAASGRGTTRSRSGASRGGTSRGGTSRGTTSQGTTSRGTTSRGTTSRGTASPGTTASSGGTGRNGGAAEPPIPGYDDLNATEVVQRLANLSQEQLGAVKRYERAHDKRSTVLERVEALEGREPWEGYDAQDVDAIRAALRDADEATVQRVRDYERRHKGRTGVLEATERETAGARS